MLNSSTNACSKINQTFITYFLNFYVMKRILFSGCFLFIAVVSFAQPSFIKDSLDAYIKEGMKKWDVPGLAIVIVKDGKVVMMKGYGVKDIKTNAPVDENTLF